MKRFAVIAISFAISTAARAEYRQIRQTVFGMD
jgi:hypothetical protein